MDVDDYIKVLIHCFSSSNFLFLENEAFVIVSVMIIEPGEVFIGKLLP